MAAFFSVLFVCEHFAVPATRSARLIATPGKIEEVKDFLLTAR